MNLKSLTCKKFAKPSFLHVWILKIRTNHGPEKCGGWKKKFISNKADLDSQQFFFFFLR